MTLPLAEQSEPVQRLVAIASEYDVVSLRRAVQDVVADLPRENAPHVAIYLIGALDRFIDSYVDQIGSGDADD